jgi:hypothetical protein
MLLATGYFLAWNGVRLAGLALICGVVSEAFAVTVAAKSYGATKAPAVVSDPRLPSSLGGVWRFYWPLANSMLVVWGGRALLVAVVARAVDGPLALAAWPAAWGLTLVVANATRMVQQVVIRNRDSAGQRLLLGFAASVGLALSLLLLAIGASPVGRSIVNAFVGRDAALSASVQPVILLCAVVPLLVALQNGIQGFLIADGRTGRINIATWLGTSCLLIVATLGIQMELPGATAAALAMVAAIVTETVLLAFGLRPVVFTHAATTLAKTKLSPLTEKASV